MESEIFRVEKGTTTFEPTTTFQTLNTVSDTSADALIDFAGFSYFILALICLLWFGVLLHCAWNKKLSDVNRVLGIFLILILGPLGCIVYFVLPRKY